MSGSVTVWLPATCTWTGWGVCRADPGEEPEHVRAVDQVAFEPLDRPSPPPPLQQGAVPALLSSTAIWLMSLPLNFAPWSTDGSGAPLEEMVCQ